MNTLLTRQPTIIHKMPPLSIIHRKIRVQFRKLSKLTNKVFSRSYFKAIVLLNLIALLNFYSVAGKKAFISHAVIFIIGTLLAVIIANINYDHIKRLAIPIYISACSLVLFVAIIGTKVNGARRWLSFAGLTIQPSEFFKLALIIIVAYYLELHTKPDTRKGRRYDLIDLIVPLTLTIIPVFLILRQPDLGTAIICLIITSSILLFMGIERKTFMFILLITFAGGAAGWNHLKPYQKNRIAAFINPNDDVMGKAWQAHQSILSFSSGGFSGKGIKKGVINQLGYLPERSTDFALASMAEEHGLISIIFILGLINFVVVRLLSIAHNIRDRFSAVIAIGTAFWIGAQTIINTAMVVGIAPIVGIQIPFISAGGSGLLSILIAIGILANIEYRR